jgi:mannose PTS system EIIA component
MSIGLLLITHDDVGASLLQTAINMFGHCPLRNRVLSINMDTDTDRCRQDVKAIIADLDSGSGVLILTDMYGSTPCNIASTLMAAGRVNVIAGLSLPMLVRVFNYPSMDLEQITHKAVSGGHDGIMLCSSDE